MTSIRYCPGYWLKKSEEANAQRRHEEAAGYAFLSMCLCRYFALTTTGEEYKGASLDLKYAMRVRLSVEQYDQANISVNLDDQYFDILHQKCLVMLITTLENANQPLKAMAYYADLFGSSWCVEVAQDVCQRLEGEVLPRLQHKIKAGAGDVPCLRQGPHDYWKSPYDVKLDKEGMRRLNHIFVEGAELFRVDSVALQRDIYFTRDKYGKPCLYYRGSNGEPLPAKAKIFRERSNISFGHNGGDESATFCDHCLQPLWKTPEEERPMVCCALMKSGVVNFCSIECKTYAGFIFHDCAYVQDQVFIQATLREENINAKPQDEKITDALHRPSLLFERLLQIHKLKAIKFAPAVHPLQHGVLPFIDPDHARPIPWNFDDGIIEVIDMLMKHGVDPWATSYWDIPTILTLWRKFGHSAFGPRDIKPEPTRPGKSWPAFVTIPGMATFIRHSCEPNAVLKTRGNLMTLETIKEIRLLEEITIDHFRLGKGENSAEQTRQEQKEVMNNWKMECSCPTCCREWREEGKKPVTSAPSKNATQKKEEWGN